MCNFAIKAEIVECLAGGCERASIIPGGACLSLFYRVGASLPLAGSKGSREGAGINLRAVAAAGAAPPLSLAPRLRTPATPGTEDEHTLTFLLPGNLFVGCRLLAAI